MRKALTAIVALAAMPIGAASAADMALKAPPPVAQTVFSWTGFYIGGEAGYGDERADNTRLIANGAFLAGTTDSQDRTGGLFGFDVGGNYQFNWIVVGVEGDFQWSSIGGNVTEFGNTAAALAVNSRSVEYRELDWVDTVTGRLGVAWDRWLLYAKGGGAWRRINDSGLNTTFNGLTGALQTNSTTFPSTESGYVVGGGVEYAPIDQLSLRVEGDWYDFGNNLSTGGVCLAGAPCGGPGAIIAPGESTTKGTVWEIKGGVNVRLNWFMPH
jgi:outer membrane immunogenic protein